MSCVINKAVCTASLARSDRDATFGMHFFRGQHQHEMRWGEGGSVKTRRNEPSKANPRKDMS